MGTRPGDSGALFNLPFEGEGLLGNSCSRISSFAVMACKGETFFSQCEPAPARVSLQGWTARVSHFFRIISARVSHKTHIQGGKGGQARWQWSTVQSCVEGERTL